MPTSAIFAGTPMRAGMYESFYLRAVDPRRPVAIWVRNTVHKRPGAPPRGSVWCTIFDARRGRPFTHKLTTSVLDAPPEGWISIGDPDAEGALLAGDPMALASALRKIDMQAAALPLRPRGFLAAASHLMIAHPFPYGGFGRLFITHPPTGERVRRLEALAGYPR